MTNSEIADILKTYADLGDLHGENPFKTKSFASASFRIDKITEPLFGKSLSELEKVEGVGKSIAIKINELFSTGTFKELSDLLEATPQGVRQIMRIKGLGPKKVAVIWKEMNVESIGELLYACKENRLAQFKGFGLKTQEAVIKQIEFMFASANKFHYAKAYPVALEFISMVKNIQTVQNISLTGEIRRKLEVLEQIDILIGVQNSDQFYRDLSNFSELVLGQNEIKYQGFKFNLILCKPDEFFERLFETSSVPEHAEKVIAKLIGLNQNFESENVIYEKAGLPYIVPELRENRGEIEKALSGKLPVLIEYTDLKGPLHNHSTWSDGLHTIDVMAKFCMDRNYEYLGMADHSKSAFYANGLSEERVFQQQDEIRNLNKKFGDKFKVFAGIECDILYDGNLDYSNDILKTFDYVVASIHSILKMTEEKAMSRLLKAIENPYTTILGHPTGRLLLMREGYPIDHHKIIDACAANGVIMELNANPYRLDMDWRFIDYALNKGVMISINPDAHEVEGFYDMFYGTEVARKGGLNKEMCLNAHDTTFLQAHFARKKG